ncbi:MAG: class I SAM-dependent methyltransferase [Acidobacteriota bacterium]
MKTRGNQPSFLPERLELIHRLESWHFWFRGRRLLLEQMIDHYLSDCRRVLDVGCGTGSLQALLSARGYSVVGLDQGLEGLRWIRKEQEGLFLLQGCADLMPVRKSSMEAALLLDVLEHADDRAVVKEVHRVLQPAGLAIITVPAASWLWGPRDVAAGHRRRYGHARLRRLLGCGGFDVVHTRYYQSLLFPLFVASRLVARRSEGVEHEEEIPRWLNALLLAVNRVEVRLGRWIPLPWGSSLVVVARKRDLQAGERSSRRP